MNHCELHLFILWSKAGQARENVLSGIGRAFTVLRIFRLHWQQTLFSNNLTRFYGQHLPPGCDKEKSCGTGPLTLVVVRDEAPQYATRQTTRGPQSVNTRVFDLKDHFRSAIGGGLPIHATNTPTETDHDLSLLLGVSTNEFEQVYHGPWNGELVDLKRDISGAQGWKNYRELFSILNATVSYVVLRNFDELPDHHKLDVRGDVDLLVENPVDAVLAANARPVFDDPHRVHYTVLIDNEAVPFDFRYAGDRYYDPAWEEHILASRRLTSDGIFVPDPENHFFTLLYHAAVHKEAVSLEYRAKLKRLASDLDIALSDDAFFDSPRQLRSFLRRFMSPRNYRFTRPSDPSVIFRRDVAVGWLDAISERFLPVRRPAITPVIPALANLPAHPPPPGVYLSLLRSLELSDDTKIIDLTLDCAIPSSHDGIDEEKPTIFLAANALGVNRFNGLADRPPPYMSLYGTDPTALGKSQLAHTLTSAGFAAQRYYYPFPDHEPPKVVIADSALRESSFDVANMLALVASRDSSGRLQPSFHEQMVWHNVIANGLLPDLSNAFLVVASRNESALVKFDPTFLAAAYTPDRLPRYATETVFRKASHGAITVEKKTLFPDRAMNLSPPTIAEGELVHHVGTVCNYVPGTLYVVELQRRLARGEGLDAVIDWARDWLELVKAARMEDSALLPGHWMDAIPQNFIRTADGKLANIDAEWSVSKPVPAAWVIFRGLTNALAVCPTSPALSGFSLLEVIRHTNVSVGIELDDAAIQQACELEVDLQVIVNGKMRDEVESRLRHHLSMPPQSGIGGPTSREACEARCATLENEIRRVKSTISWRITIPLRVSWNVLRRIKWPKR